MTFEEEYEKVKRIFLKARDCAPEETPQLLEEACQGDSSLRAQVDSLLAHHAALSACESSEEVCHEDCSEDSTTRSVDLERAHLPDGQPLSIGPYKILGVLGEGGMGTVYLADQQEPVRRRVALKVIKLGMDTKAVVARFEAERQALAMMNHPNIASVYEAGATEDGRPYFVMEYVQGTPITEYCDRHKLTIGERLDLFVKVCLGVEHAHHRGIIHRDIKPQNILVSTPDEQAVVKIIDFGVAKATNQRLTEKTIYTGLGRTVGTPAYMSPEQAEMTTEDVDHRADVYSLGVLLYELLVGELPLDWESLSKAAFDEITRRIREEDPPVPSVRWSRLNIERTTELAARRRTRPSTLRSELRGDLDWVCTKALEKNRERRYPTAAELGAEINRYLNREPVLARKPGVVYRLKKFVKKYRRAVAAVSGVVAVLLVSLTVVIAMYLDVRDARKNEAKNASEARSALEAKTHALRQSEGLRLLAKSSAIAESNPGLAILLAVEGAKHSPGLTAQNTLLEVLRELRERKTLIGHEDAVLAGSFSPDGRRVLTGSWDGTARLWDAFTGKPILTLEGHNGGLTVAVYSPDGRFILTASEDMTARVWDAVTGAGLHVLEGHTRKINAASFGVNSDWVVTASEDKTVRLWRPAEAKEADLVLPQDHPVTCLALDRRGKLILAGCGLSASVWGIPSAIELSVFRGHTSDITGVTFIEDDSRAVTTSLDGTARVWNVENGKEMGVLEHQSEVLGCAYSSPRGRLLTNARDAARLWSVSDVLASLVPGHPEPEPTLLRGHAGQVHHISFSRDGDLAATASADTTTQVWDLRRGVVVHTFRGHEAYVLSAAFSPDGKNVVTASGDRTARLWQTGSPEGVHALESEGQVNFVFFGAKGERLVTVLENGAVRLWRITGGSEQLEREIRTVEAGPAVISPDGRRIVTVEGRRAAVRDGSTGEILKPLVGHWGTVLSAAFSPDGGRVVTTSTDETARVWTVASGDSVALKGHRGAVYTAVFSPDGAYVLTASADRTARLWDGRLGTQLRAFEGHTAGVISAVFDSQGTRAVTASRDGTARIWALEEKGGAVVLEGHGSGLTAAAFGRGGAKVVTSSDDGSARVWDVESGREIHELSGHESSVTGLVVSPDGGNVLSFSEDGTARLWTIEGGEELLTLRHDAPVRSATFSPDGRTVVTATGNEARLFPLDPFAVAVRRKPRELTSDEENRFPIDAFDKKRKLSSGQAFPRQDNLYPHTTLCKVGEYGGFSGVEIVGSRTYRAEDIIEEIHNDPEFIVLSHPQAPMQNYLHYLRDVIRLGYLAGGFSDVKIRVRPDPLRRVIVASIEEGRRVIAGPLAVEGTDELPEDPGLGWEEGKPANLNPLFLRRKETQVRRAYSLAGHLDAEVNAGYRENEDGTVSLVVNVVKEGTRGRLGTIGFEGRFTDNEEEIKKLLQLEPGTLIDRDLLSRIRRKLDGLGRYYKTDVELRPSEEEGRADLVLRLFQADFALPWGEEKAEHQVLRKALNWLENTENWGCLVGTLGGRFKNGSPLDAEHALADDRSISVTLVLSARKGYGFQLQIFDPQARRAETVAFLFRNGEAMLVIGPERVFARLKLENLPLKFNFGHEIEKEAGDVYSAHWNFGFGLESRSQFPEIEIEFSQLAATHLYSGLKQRGFVFHEEGGYLSIDYPPDGKDPQRLANINRETGAVESLSLKISDQEVDFVLSLENGALTRIWKQVERQVQELGCERIPAPRLLAKAAAWVVEEAAPIRRPRSAEFQAGLLFLESVLGNFLEELASGVRESSTEVSLEEEHERESFVSWRPDSTVKLVVWLFKAFDLETGLPYDSWPYTLLREATGALIKDEKYLVQELVRLLRSPDVGPLGYWLLAERWSNVPAPVGTVLSRDTYAMPGQERELDYGFFLAKRGLEVCNLQGFRQDLEILAGEDFLFARVLAAAGKAFKNIEPEVLQAMGLARESDVMTRLLDLHRNVQGVEDDREAGERLVWSLWDAGLGALLRKRFETLRGIEFKLSSQLGNVLLTVGDDTVLFEDWSFEGSESYIGRAPGKISQGEQTLEITKDGSRIVYGERSVDVGEGSVHVIFRKDGTVSVSPR